MLAVCINLGRCGKDIRIGPVMKMIRDMRSLVSNMIIGGSEVFLVHCCH